MDLGLDEHVLRMCADPNRMHYLVMKLCGDAGGSSSPRATLGMQFRVDVPGDAMGRDGAVLLRWRNLEHGRVFVEAGQELVVMARVSAALRRDGRDVAAWPDAQSWQKVEQLFARHGMALCEPGGRAPLQLGPSMRAAGTWARDLMASVRVDDVEAAQAAFDNGIGRCKNYGLGMLVVAE